ncbi:MAG: lytic transglycosylase domain-containing protein, partial [Proteobacteria bacterium]|nr:lytic transglycosylase domain-containing protein [Pseudomonadota bacterium]
NNVRQRIDSCIELASQKYDVPSELIRGIIKAESGFKPDVVSPAGARGLMQLMPGTAEDLGVKNPFDIYENIDGGVRYFKQMMNKFDGDVKLSLAAYNAGPGAVERYEGVPPYRETQRYIRKVMKYSDDIT